MSTRRYAEGTDVDVSKSVEDLKRLAERYDASEFTYAIGPRGGSAMFRLEGVPLRYDVQFPTDDDLTVKQAEQEWRRRWRVVLLRAKGQFEAITDGELSVERAFLAEVMLPDGTTVGERIEATGIEGLEGELLPQLTAGGTR